ncbi:TetR/AcrR family transcriptional regulator [Nocardioides sp. GY 10127]|uniref:TetR/AcrR family transcriptional regulator n=1 Tax=Nocardioides sp. GY 10127 TaxID=2569762 RepID=UPI0010A7E652|nr:TetR/AcrR family transcriptional regulator [Nocardioides sp. GY 10127]TIC80138.1 TetR/AcrR family transcriptional regulator [Nocardioides sp. GY 10127]
MDEPAPRTARERARVELTRAILERAEQQLAEVGPAALSLRAVARDLGMASSAVYRYVDSRDALLTLLLVAGYDDLADALEASQRPEDDLGRRWHALGHALRDWARAQPHRWALLYGSPVPGYAAPETTVGPATRVVAPFLRLLQDRQTAGVEAGAEAGDEGRGRTPEPALAQALLPVSSALADAGHGPVIEAGRTADGLAAWSALVGAVSLELFGHFNQAVLDYDLWFAHLLGRLETTLGG